MASSSSSSNNPFVAEENNNNNNNNENNENNDQSKKDDNFKFLEEDPSNIAPPPAYEDIEKPPPALPGYNHNGRPMNNDLSYPPPRTPPPENYNRPNFFSTPSNPSNYNKRNNGVGCCGSSRNKNCGCGWLIVLIIFVILTAISVINNNVCGKLTLEDTTKFSFDPTTANILRIDVDTSRIKRGDVRIFNGQPNQQQVEIEVLTGSNGVTPRFRTSTRDGIYELDISQTSGFSLFNIPPRCMRMQANIYLPSSSIDIQVKALDIMVNSGTEYQQNITLTTDNGDIIFSDGVSAQNIKLLTSNGEMLFKNVTVKGSFNITTFGNGDIEGSIYLSNNLSIRTIDSDVDLLLKIAQGANANIEVNTVDGDVGLSFDNTFLGNYVIQTNDGGIRIGDSEINGRRTSGTISTGGSNLTVFSDDGDAIVLF